MYEGERFIKASKVICTPSKLKFNILLCINFIYEIDRISPLIFLEGCNIFPSQLIVCPHFHNAAHFMNMHYKQANPVVVIRK